MSQPLSTLLKNGISSHMVMTCGTGARTMNLTVRSEMLSLGRRLDHGDNLLHGMRHEDVINLLPRRRGLALITEH